MKRHRLLTIYLKLKFAIFFFLFGREDSGEILACVWQEDENFEILKTLLCSIYPTSFSLCYERDVNLLHT